MTDPFTTEISRHIWDSKYRYRAGDETRDTEIADTWRRVARALASVEAVDQAGWEERFNALLADFRFLPGGRILAGAGTDNQVTLFNCFVMGTIEDSMDGIFDALKEGALTMQQGGGVGYDFSTLRPSGTAAHRAGTIASGPVSFMRIWDSMCGTILSTGARRGAMMATLRIDHPDIEKFVDAKRDSSQLRHFNLSVLVSDEFLEAVKRDESWALVFPAEEAAGDGGDAEFLSRKWPGHDGEVRCLVLRRVRARELWDRIMRATYDYAEPGVLFIDRINELNNLWYRESIVATNPCGEIPLAPYGACDLGSINLTQFVRDPFGSSAGFDTEGVCEAVQLAVRMLDNVIDASLYPLEAQRVQAQGARRIGLGVTGLADALIMLNLHYDSDEGRRFAGDVMRDICQSAYRSSVELAREKGPFPFFDSERYLEAGFVRGLPGEIRDAIASHGIRNSHLTAIAPTGTISLLANNISSGLEPVYDFEYSRRVLERDGNYTTHRLRDYAWDLWRREEGEQGERPHSFVDAHELSPQAHLKMAATLQPFVDNAISKTINVPEDYNYEAFKSLYAMAYDQGLKGCTTFRPNPVTGQILSAGEAGLPKAHCCDIEREAD